MWPCRKDSKRGANRRLAGEDVPPEPWCSPAGTVLEAQHVALARRARDH